MNKDEYNAALYGAALFDLTGTSIIEVKGPDAASFLNNISTNDIINLPVGGGCETYFCDHRAKVLFQANVRRFSREEIVLDTIPGYGEPLLKHLDKYLISEVVELANIADDTTIFHLAGPHAGGLTNGTFSEFQHSERNLGHHIANIRRRDFLGTSGYDIFCKKTDARSICKYFLENGATSSSPETLNVLRIEAGTPFCGIDIDENRFVMEVANAARAVCYTKGCFIGQEPIVMSRDRAGGVNRLFVGMTVNSKQATPYPGFKVFTTDPKTFASVEVGIVTSTTWSPRLDLAIGIGYVRRGFHEKGTLLFDEGGIGAKVLGYPPLQRSSIC
jgi:folate-binding protein YgfZ